MSAPGRPKGEFLRPQAEGTSVNAQGRSQALIPGARSTQGAPVSEAARRAALTLHALHPRDQRWVLQRLAPTERVEVKGLLRELQRLGIPGDRPLLQAALAGGGTEAAEAQAQARAEDAAAGPAAVASPPAAPRLAGAVGDSAHHAAGRLAVDATAAGLAGAAAVGVGTGAPPESAARCRFDAVRSLPLHEPAFVWAACLLDLPPAGQARLLAALPPSKATAVRALMAGGLADAVALRQAVRHTLAERVPPMAESPPAPRGAALQRALGALRGARLRGAWHWARRALAILGLQRQWVGSGGRA